MRRLIPTIPPRSAAPGRLDPGWVGVWLGLVVGYAELGIRVAARYASGHVTAATLATNHHSFWMIPLCDLLLIGGAGVLLGRIAARSARPAVARACLLLPCFLAAQAIAMTVPGLHKTAALVLAAGVAWRLAMAIDGHRDRFRALASRTVPALGAILAVLVAVGAWTVAGGEGRALAALPRPEAGSPNVLLIVLDTVRADALSMNRADRDTTPHLARLAERGVRFDRAKSTAPWTLPAHASLFTGRWPHEHSANVGRALDAAHPTIAEALAGRGYATAAFMANTHNGNAWYGLDRGFAHYEDLYENRAVSAFEILRSTGLGWKLAKSRAGRRLLGSLIDIPRLGYRKTAAMINRDLLAWLPTRGDRPFFAFLNYYDVHDPYVVPPGADRAFARSGEGRPRSVLETARDDYDDCLRSLDEEVGRLLADLEGRGLLDDTLIIVTSDHGEAFGEHDLQGHGISLYRPELHVPLLVVQPGRVPGGRTVAEPVSTRDIPETILDLIRHDGDFPGTSLARFWSGPPGAVVPQQEPVLATVSRSAKLSTLRTNAPARLGPMYALIDDGHKLIRNGDGREELYHLASDPDEANDLAPSPGAADTLDRLRAQLSRIVDGAGKGSDR
ncbi:sulfatase [Tundrisphaera sp. TA3]|uniref:sulfatase n=1 Tax=Tundrisphaera sp. TA3 TaxID=3435775 RepID=UPI003EBD02CC